MVAVNLLGVSPPVRRLPRSSGCWVAPAVPLSAALPGRCAIGTGAASWGTVTRMLPGPAQVCFVLPAPVFKLPLVGLLLPALFRFRTAFRCEPLWGLTLSTMNVQKNHKGCSGQQWEHGRWQRNVGLDQPYGAHGDKPAGRRPNKPPGPTGELDEFSQSVSRPMPSGARAPSLRPEHSASPPRRAVARSAVRRDGVECTPALIAVTSQCGWVSKN